MNLRNKLAFFIALNSYVELITRGTSPLSLPSAVANSLSYVKAFGGTEQRNLPDNYIERQFIYMMDGSYLLTDIVPTYDCKIEMDFQTTSVPTGSVYLLGGRTNVYGGIFFAQGGTGVCIVDAFGTSSDDRYTSSVSLSSNTHYKFTFNNKVATLESGGTTLFTNTFTGENANGAALIINGLNDNGTLKTTQVGIYLYSFKVWNAQGELVMNLVPAVEKGTVPVVGFYDTVSKTFKTATAGTFTAGGEAVPTPDAPMDIVSNNGVLKARHASGLPLGYTLLDYIESTGTQYIDTGILINKTLAKKLTLESEMLVTSTDGYRLCGIGGVRSQFYFGLNPSTHFAYGSGNTDADTNKIASLDTWYKYSYSPKNGKYTVRDSNDEVVTSTSFNFSENFSVKNYPILLFAYASGSTGGATGVWSGKISSFKVYEENVLIQDMVSARSASGVVGMYDTVNNRFYTNSGTGEFVAGNPVSDPVEIYTDGTVETIKDSLNNTATAEMLLKVGNYQDAQSIIDGTVTRNVGVMVLDGTENWGLATAWGTHAFSLPRFDGGSKMVPVICSHNTNYAGSTIVSLNQQCTMRGSSFILSNNDYTNTSATDFKQWLADQYAAGTPVIIVYPLATPTTESVAGQTLQVQAGDNTLEITQASLDGLELEAEYKKRK